jgi:citrate synthase
MGNGHARGARWLAAAPLLDAVGIRREPFIPVFAVSRCAG